MPEDLRASDVDVVARALGGRGWPAAQALLERFGSVRALARADVAEVARVKGVGRARAERVAAALALGRRLIESHEEPSRSVVDPASAFGWLGPPLQALAVEELHALYLDRRSRPITHRRLTRGSDAFTVVDPRQVFRAALALDACALVLAHNHPSGDPTPSVQDREVTRRLAQAGRTLGVDLLDHLVVGAGAWVSMRANGDFVPTERTAAAWTS